MHVRIVQIIGGLFGVLVLLCLILVVANWEEVYWRTPLYPKPGQAPRAAPTRDGRWEQDIDYLVDTLTRVHVDPFYVTDEATWRAEAARIKAAIPSLNDDELTFEIYKLVARVKDAHTHAVRPTHGRPQRYPIQFTVFDEGIFVTRVTEESASVFGAQLVGINKYRIDAVLDRITPALAYENDWGHQFLVASVLNNPTFLQLAQITPNTDEVTFVFRRADTTEVAVTLHAQPREDIRFREYPFPAPLYLRALDDHGPQSDVPLWYTYLPEHKAIYLQYNSAQKTEAFQQIAAAALNEAKVQGATTFIVDVRFNGGGNSWPFTQYLSNPLRDHPITAHGRVYGIMGRATFSSGFRAIADLKQHNKATIIGEPAMTRLNYFGEVTNFKLPNSHIVVQYPQKRSVDFPEYNDARVYEPDIMLPLTVADFFSGRDPYLEAALKQ